MTILYERSLTYLFEILYKFFSHFFNIGLNFDIVRHLSQILTKIHYGYLINK